MNAYDISLERGRLRVVVATVVINVVAVSLLTFAPGSDWRTGATLNIVDNCLLIGFTLVRRDALLGRFLLFGIVVGFCELPADAWLVDYTGTLDYQLAASNDLAIATLDATSLGSCGSANRIRRTAIMGTVWQDWVAHDRTARRNQYSVLRGDGAKNSLVAIQRLPHDFIYAVVHRSRRVRDRDRIRVAWQKLRPGSWRRAVVAGIVGGFSIFVCYALAFWITDRLVI